MTKEKKETKIFMDEPKPFKQKLLDARREMSNPSRGGKVEFQKGRKYVTLQDLYDEVIPCLMNERLLLVNEKDFKDGTYFFKTRILDVDSEESIETSSVLNADLKIQDQGSELTYHSRYNLGCLLSIRTDYDDDAESIKSKEMRKNGYIKPEQMHELSKILSGISVDKYKEILSTLKIKDFSKIPYDRYEKSVKYIEKCINKHIGVDKTEEKKS